ncbi:ATP-binding protein [Actinoplanes sp. N902-109]|uniref:ATP-binding protein n=1 Tax=Actinoplanes sp. (strain N902-109) TaxID=649831 RepID=UPI00032966AE|nr:ATP-binding protein [Actinoplanes sp. N902-109]AGL17204.1 anti-sigma regulatory factor, serine/threonine protein kinase [Actinoplanes sp. N902-109]
MAIPPDGHPDPAVLLAVTFTLAQIDDVRRRVRALSAGFGLAGDELTDWVMAINELTTNAVRHGSTTAHLTLRCGAELTCEVRDEGTGFDPARFFGRTVRPQLTESGGMGLWLVERTTRVLSVTSGPGGTTVSVAALVSPGVPAQPA